MSEIRKRKIESLLREEISNVITRGRIKDPRLQGMYTITEVSASRDYRDAKVFVSVVGPDDDRRQRVVDALNHAAGYVQGLVGRAVRLKATPRLRFILDTSIERGVSLIHRLEDLGPVDVPDPAPERSG